jgi:hypothetical protein
MSTYSPDLRIELISNGAQPGQWGTTTNNTWAYLIDPAISGFQTVAVTSANQALTYVSGSSTTASANQSIYATLAFTTSLGTAFTIYAPPNPKQYVIWNNSSQTMTICNSDVIGSTTPSGGATVTIAAGRKVQVFSTGVSFYQADADNVTGTVPIANGGTGQVTANAAFNALAPVQTSYNNRFLTTNGTNTSWGQVDVSTAAITGTMGVGNGGTGAATLTGLAYGNATSAFTAATAAQVVAVIGPTAVANATNAVTSANCTALVGLGFGGSVWNNLTGSRALNTTYTNSRAYPIAVSAYCTSVGVQSFKMTVNGVLVYNMVTSYDGASPYGTSGGMMIIPAGATYSLDMYGGITAWYELYKP